MQDLQGVFFQSASRMRPVWGLFLDFRGPQRLLWDPKDGRKLLLGTEDTFMMMAGKRTNFNRW